MLDTPVTDLSQAKEGFLKIAAASTETTGRLKDSYSAAVKGAQDYNSKVLDFTGANLNVIFEFAQKLTSLKSPKEFFQLSSDHAHKQFKTLTEQAKELAAMARKISLATTEPLKMGVTNASIPEA